MQIFTKYKKAINLSKQAIIKVFAIIIINFRHLELPSILSLIFKLKCLIASFYISLVVSNKCLKDKHILVNFNLSYYRVQLRKLKRLY